jgi:hypothetical protein
VKLMSDTPADEGPADDPTESVPDLLADELSPVVHPDYDSGSRAGSGGAGANAASERGNGPEGDDKPERG